MFFEIVGYGVNLFLTGFFAFFVIFGDGIDDFVIDWFGNFAGGFQSFDYFTFHFDSPGFDVLSVLFAFWPEKKIGGGGESG